MVSIVTFEMGAKLIFDYQIFLLNQGHCFDHASFSGQTYLAMRLCAFASQPK
jgi:hypothetical protein